MKLKRNKINNWLTVNTPSPPPFTHGIIFLSECYHSFVNSKLKRALTINLRISVANQLPLSPHKIVRIIITVLNNWANLLR